MEARDYIAIITVLSGMILLALDIDSLVGAILIAVISYYFGMGQREDQKSRKDGTNLVDAITNGKIPRPQEHRAIQGKEKEAVGALA